MDSFGFFKSFPRGITATARFSDYKELLQKAGATAVFNIYTEAGAELLNMLKE